jgi:hypothetical protein
MFQLHYYYQSKMKQMSLFITIITMNSIFIVTR